ncbi:MAG: NAD(P)/FAD-dependent oxidoreductase [Myxococcota bacterium]
MRKKRVVIVGGGFGGLTLARKLKRAPVDVTIIDRENHHLFQPLLYQVATASLSPGDIAIPIRTVLRRHKNAEVLMGEVRGVDYDARRLRLSDGETVDYDYLVIAAGAKTNFFGNDRWEEHAFGMKNLREALTVREKILVAFEEAERMHDSEARRDLLTFVVIGGGPTGVEVAGAISELSRQTLRRDFRNVRPEEIRVILVEAADRLLTDLSPELSASAEASLQQLEVEVLTGHKVTDMGPAGPEVDGELIPALMVIWAAGVRAVTLAESSGLPLEWGRIKVEQDCSVPGHPNVFAIGDIAFFVPAGESDPLPQVSPVAMQQGRHVARMILDSELGFSRAPFLYRDKGSMATIGRSKAVAEVGTIKLRGFVAWVAWLVVHIVYLIDFQNRLAVLLSWFFAYVVFRRGARLISKTKNTEFGHGPSLLDKASSRGRSAGSSGGVSSDGSTSVVGSSALESAPADSLPVGDISGADAPSAV